MSKPQLYNYAVTVADKPEPSFVSVFTDDGESVVATFYILPAIGHDLALCQQLAHDLVQRLEGGAS